MIPRYALFPPLDTRPSWLYTPGRLSSYADFVEQARCLAANLPARRYMINLCDNRERFILSFLAAQLVGQTVLLPPSRSRHVVAEIARDYPDCYALHDEVPVPAGIETVDFARLEKGEGRAGFPAEIPGGQIAALVFTSGSTGKPRPNPKTWEGLVRGVELARARFGFDADCSVVATVPPQHMYGLETSVMTPLITGSRLWSGRPFYPQDVREALTAVPAKRILITTPIHLRALHAADLAWPDIECIISATAPLHVELAKACEVMFRAPVLEIYGCTEAGSLASRQVTRDPLWRLYDDFSLSVQAGKSIVSAPHLPQDVVLGDVIEQLDDARFRLLGRDNDMLKIAGKRASLADLNLRLCAVEGVEDGVIFLPEPKASLTETRLTALVVAPDLDEDAIFRALVGQIDPVFLPRTLRKVDVLPRNRTGKLTRQALREFMARIG